MALKIRVVLEDEVEFKSKKEQDEIAQKIDEETFFAPTFVGSHRKNRKHVTINTPLSDIPTEYAEMAGQIVADHFGSTVDSVRVLSG